MNFLQQLIQYADHSQTLQWGKSTPLIWTTNQFSTYLNGTVDKDGYGYDSWSPGSDYWLLDVAMDCDHAGTLGYFEFKAYAFEVGGWEHDIEQLDPIAFPDAFKKSKNHVARCGMVNIFEFGTNTGSSIQPLEKIFRPIHD